MPSIYDYGVIGNLRTAALVSRFGGVDWLCLPRFSSASVFGRLLDAARGGTFEIVPLDPDPSTSEQSYLPSTNVLLTRSFLRRERQLDLLDFMPVQSRTPGEEEEMPALVRVVEARGGPVRVRLRIEPRFDYGRETARWAGGNDVHVARGGSAALWTRVNRPMQARTGSLEATLDLADGERIVLELGLGEGPGRSPPVESLLRETLRYWQSWVHPPTTPIHRIAGQWHAGVERSELVLKLLSVAETGAFLAAPTTSLPEWPGGSRNWDYRYVWVRDAAFCAQALLLLGHFEEAERFLSWVVERVGGEGGSADLRVMYPAVRTVPLEERELAHFTGYLDSKPVRVGNGAETQFQLDIYGELLDAARLLGFRRPAAVRPVWDQLRDVTERVVRLWRRPDHGIWEVRLPPRQYVYSKVMAWVALDRSMELARRFDDAAAYDRWAPVREEIRTWILHEGYDRTSRTFTQSAGEDAIDAVNLRIPIVGFLPFEDERVRRTVARVRRELGVGPFVYRYRTDDGIEGPEGTFLPAAFWLVECLARQGHRRLAKARFRRLLEAASPLGLYPEEYDPGGNGPLGNYPQSLTHIGFLRATVALGAMEMPSFATPSTERDDST